MVNIHYMLLCLELAYELVAKNRQVDHNINEKITNNLYLNYNVTK